MFYKDSSVLYDNQLPFTGRIDWTLPLTYHAQKDKVTALPKLIFSLIARIDKKLCSIILIDGAGGTGKTTLDIHIMQLVNIIYGNPMINLDNPIQLAMGGTQFQTKLLACRQNELHSLTYDEAGDVSAENRYSQLNKNINRAFDILRGYSCLLLVSLPKFYTLDKRLIDNDNVRCLIHIDERTLNDADYSVYDMTSLRRMYEDKKDYGLAYNPYLGYKDFIVFKGHFHNLPIDMSVKLDKLCMRAKDNILLHNQIKEEGLLSYSEIAGKLGMSNRTLIRKVKELGIKPMKQYKLKNYYSKDVIGLLVNYKKGD
jgi:hypothetical protein